MNEHQGKKKILKKKKAPKSTILVMERSFNRKLDIMQNAFEEEEEEARNTLNGEVTALEKLFVLEFDNKPQHILILPDSTTNDRDNREGNRSRKINKRK